MLFCAVTAVLILGFLLMKKLDRFLENNRRLIDESADASSLTIALENPALADSISDLLESFLKKNPGCELHLVTGNAENILHKLSDDELDFCFVTPSSVTIFNTKFISVSFPLRQKPLISETLGLPVVPLESQPIMTKVIWKEGTCNLNKKMFADQLYQHYQNSQMLS